MIRTGIAQEPVWKSLSVRYAQMAGMNFQTGVKGDAGLWHQALPRRADTALLQSRRMPCRHDRQIRAGRWISIWQTTEKTEVLYVRGIETTGI